MNVSDALIGLIRTAVPAAAGSVLAYLAQAAGLTEPLPDLVATSEVFTVLVIAAYWRVVHAAEKRVPWLGILLGYPVRPKYLPE